MQEQDAEIKGDHEAVFVFLQGGRRWDSLPMNEMHMHVEDMFRIAHGVWILC